MIVARKTTTESPEEALARIQGLGFGKNDALVIMAFAERGIDPDQIDPRHNVLTFHAWKALGRSVAKGAISVRVQTWIPTRGSQASEEPAPDDAPEGNDQPKRRGGGMRPKLAYLFHESQTIPQKAPKGTRPAAWANPQLVKEGTYDDGSAVVNALETRLRAYEGEPIPDDQPLTDEQQERRTNALEQVIDDMAIAARHQGTLFDLPDPIPEPQPPATAPCATTQPQIDHNGRIRTERDLACTCPLPGCVINADCPLHGNHVHA